MVSNKLQWSTHKFGHENLEKKPESQNSKIPGIGIFVMNFLFLVKLNFKQFSFQLYKTCAVRLPKMQQKCSHEPMLF